MAHTLQLLNLDLDELFPESMLQPLHPAIESRHEHIVGDKNYVYVLDKTDGQVRWDVPMENQNQHCRLVLAPDEGGPLYCVYQFLASKGACVNLVRDEAYLHSTSKA